jgi:hypothetical protein
MLTTYNEIDMTSIMQMRDLYKGTFFMRTLNNFFYARPQQQYKFSSQLAVLAVVVYIVKCTRVNPKP